MTDLPVIPSTLLTFQQVCALYPQPRRLITLKAYWATGKIPHLNMGNRVYFRLQDVEVWMADRVLTRLGLTRDESMRPPFTHGNAPDPHGPRAQVHRAVDQTAHEWNGATDDNTTPPI